MTPRSAIRAEAERLFGIFRAAGALPVDADILLPAETLLDLYGEDIRARAYVTHDRVRGEMMLRPDFTVPVVQAHMQSGADPARYCYMGEVFRAQDHLGDRPSEYLQVGFEVFDRAAPEQADAEVFALFHEALRALNLATVTGDIGILMAAIRGLDTTDRRKSALLRHIWRPGRFRALLDRFAGRAPVPPARVLLLNHLASGTPEALIAAAAPLIGLRSVNEVSERAFALLEDARTPPISALESAMLYDLLGLETNAAAALTHLRGISRHLPAITPAVDRFGARLDALSARGIEPAMLPFVASHGRSAMEYYDGFVFTFLAGEEPVASGGRYDALTAVLGQGRSIPAVGGIIRPHLVAALKGTA
jgi:ATP phosphoribosyltransferase regulatory subunit